MIAEHCKKGEITVFLSMLSLLICAFLYAVTVSTADIYARLITERITEISLESAFAEYNRELFDEYRLLFVDTGYRGYGNCTDDAFMAHFTGYVDVNMSSVTGVTYLSAELNDVVYASDNDYEAFEYQLRRHAGDIAVKYICDGDEQNGDYDSTDTEYICNTESKDRDYDSQDMISLGECEKEMAACLIEENMREKTYADFDFDNLISEATVTVYAKGPMGKVYECTKTYSMK